MEQDELGKLWTTTPTGLSGQDKVFYSGVLQKRWKIGFTGCNKTDWNRYFRSEKWKKNELTQVLIQRTFLNWLSTPYGHGPPDPALDRDLLRSLWSYYHLSSPGNRYNLDLIIPYNHLYWRKWDLAMKAATTLSLRTLTVAVLIAW